MASTEQRTGFRFGWGSKGDSEKSAGQPEQGSESTESTDPSADATAQSGDAGTSPSAAGAAQADGPQNATASNGHHVDAAGHEGTPAGSANAPQPDAWPVSDILEVGDMPAPSAEPRASGFLADLMRAMQAAADQNRKQVTDRFRDDGRALIDSVRSRSGEDLNELRRTADADVAAIREWSKAEIARIKAETDERIATRKAALDQQVNDHAALIDLEVERVESRIVSFEQQMEAFFSRLQNVADPTTFAAVAQEMPEPPAIETLGAQARAEALSEISLGTAPAPRHDSSAYPTAPNEGVRWEASDQAAEPGEMSASVSQWAVPADAAESTPEATATEDPWATSTAAVESGAPAAGIAPEAVGHDEEALSPNGTAASTSFEPAASDSNPWAVNEPPAQWQAPAQATDPWAAQAPVAGADWPSTTPEPADATLAADGARAAGQAPAPDAQPQAEAASLVYGAPAPLVAEALGSSPSGGRDQTPAPGDRTAGSWPSSYEADPRLAALGIDGPQGAAFTTPSPDEQPAPAAAADPWATPSGDSAPTSSGDQFAAMPGEAFGTEPSSSSESPAARLAGLVPSSELPANGRTLETAQQPVPTQVVVTGLLSVASIASFKRHLSRIPGVQGVGVSSGPDGEFIFKTTHEPGVALADVIPTLPGFGAEVVNAAEGTINVAAHDPEADA